MRDIEVDGEVDGPDGANRIDFMRLANHYLKALALCLAVSALLYLFTPSQPYQVPLVYSVCIGTVTWAIVEFGRHLLDPSPESGWPAGMRGLWLVLAAIAGGYLLGTTAADAWFGWSSWHRDLLEQRSSWLVSLLAGGAGCYYFYNRSQQSRLHGKIEQAQRLAAEAQLKLLQAQLEPHMLFNTLANLRVLIGADPARAQQMLDHLIDYLRATLAASRAPEHALSAEFERLRDYLELMAVRMGPRLAYTLELPPELAGEPVPTLLLQPLVENSIRHGLEPKVEGG
ncbi:MAG: histidine kinase, partial [Proteobacteria bacterium]|nr:histidine kinase [Pseudomonadota bacterium]